MPSPIKIPPPLKEPVPLKKSKILWTNITGGGFFLLDAVQGFINSGGFSNPCAQKSLLAGLVMIVTAALRALINPFRDDYRDDYR